MSDIAIKVENLGKKYLIRHRQEGRRYKALRDVLAEKFRRLAFRKNGSGIQRPKTEEFWALKDVSFEVRQGDSVGIIGRNGAGKSTLLKLLSRITEPSRGRIELEGRVAGLLEVGTGFHPELTGRENVYLNGAILGMSRNEIRSKFDEIVAFAQVEKFLDTPVKRYSSGMYMRLAFAIAANIEPEVLIVDEVLAVGDINFQKKCVEKISNVSNQGSTILFVSHNMDLITKVCNFGILLENGVAGKLKRIEEVVEDYVHSPHESGAFFRASTPDRVIQTVDIDQAALASEQLKVTIGYRFTEKPAIPTFGMVVYNETDHPIFGSNTLYHPPCEGGDSGLSGKATLVMDSLPLWSGLYKISVWVSDAWESIDHEPNAILFDHVARDTPLNAPSPRYIGSVHLPARWRIESDD